jgi:site-specific recombinase XerD
MVISPLRQQMQDILQMRGYASRTISSYLSAVKNLSHYYHQSPDHISPEQIQAWLFWQLKDKHLSSSTCHLRFNAVRFLFVEVLNDEDFKHFSFDLPKRQQRIPELLTQREVSRLFSACPPSRRTLLRTCYRCGLRLSELVRIRPQDIDSERLLLHVVQGKGAKDRVVPIPPALIPEWRFFWSQHRSTHWLFPTAYTRCNKDHFSVSAAQRIYTRAKRAANINKAGGIHALRHAFATHSLMYGMSISVLQAILGHRHLSTTMRYLHYLPYDRQTKSVDLLNNLARVTV